MIWLWLLLICAAMLLLLGWLGKVPRGALMPVGAALMLGLAGYVLQGQPTRPGLPVAAAAAEDDREFGEPLGRENAEMAERFGPGGSFLGMADSFLRRGKTELAAGTLAAGLKKYPDNVDLWVAYGNALIAHGGGTVSPAAALAFDEAARRNPAHPAPQFFLGLGLAQSGDLAGAEANWAALLARSPADAPWRADLESRLATIRAEQGGDAPSR
jgi:cytochrome c-type biogenesis protein CcmH/NrfG